MSGRIVEPAIIGAALWTIGIPYNAKLRANRQLIALALAKSPEKLLVRATSIHVGLVIMRDPQVQRPPQRGQRTLVVLRATQYNHAHPHEGTEGNARTEVGGRGLGGVRRGT